MPEGNLTSSGLTTHPPRLVCISDFEQSCHSQAGCCDAVSSAMHIILHSTSLHGNVLGCNNRTMFIVLSALCCRCTLSSCCLLLSVPMPTWCGSSSGAASVDPLDNCLLQAGEHCCCPLAPAEDYRASCSCAQPAAPHWVLCMHSGQMLAAAVASVGLAALSTLRQHPLSKTRCLAPCFAAVPCAAACSLALQRHAAGSAHQDS